LIILSEENAANACPELTLFARKPAVDMSRVGADHNESPLSDVAFLIDRNAATLVRVVKLEEELARLRAAADTGPEPEAWKAMEERVVALTAKYNARLRVLARWVDRTQPSTLRERGTHKQTVDGVTVAVPAGLAGPTAWDLEQVERWSKIADIEMQVDDEAAGEGCPAED